MAFQRLAVSESSPSETVRQIAVAAGWQAVHQGRTRCERSWRTATDRCYWDASGAPSVDDQLPIGTNESLGAAASYDLRGKSSFVPRRPAS